MSTSPTAQVLAQWADWSAHCTDRLFDLDARVTAQGTDEDRLDIAAVFVARKAIVERIEAMRAASAGRDDGAASALAAQPLLDEHGGTVAADLTSAATLVDRIVDRIERHLDEVEAEEAALVRAVTRLDASLTRAEELTGVLGSHSRQVAELRERRAGAPRDLAVLEALSNEADALLTELRRSDEERGRLLAALPVLPERLDALREREAAVRSLTDEVRAKVRQVPNLAIPSVDALGPAPAPGEVDQLPWPAARATVQPYVERVERLAAAFDEAERRFRAAVERRDELRGLLQAYRDKAGARRLAEDARLEPRYRAARDLLWSAPCDLDAAAPLVSGYVDAVNAVVQGRDVGEGG